MLPAWTLHFRFSFATSAEWEMELISRVLIIGVFILAAVLLTTPYESILEGVLALVLLAAVVLGFLLHPRREVYYVRTTVGLSGPDQSPALEHDYLAVKV